MKTLIIAGLMLNSISMWGADCDCAYPIKPKACVPPCRNALFMKLSKEELTSAVALKEDTASQVVTLRKETGSKSFAELEKALSPSQVKEIESKLGQLEPLKADALIRKYDVQSAKPEKPVLGDRPEVFSKKKQ